MYGRSDPSELPALRVGTVASCALLLLLAPAVAAASNCARTTTGFKPLDAPFFMNYHGFAGGLYPGNSNRRPAAHETGGRTQVISVRPRAAAGKPSGTSGTRDLSSVGISNTHAEFSTFYALAVDDTDNN